MRTTSKSRHHRTAHRRTKEGSALLIVLAFVVLMSGLVLAFFSRSILEEQVSASSANQVKVDALAIGAVSATISDLKQEIMEGSSVYYPVTGNNYIYYYIPTLVGTGTYPSMVPCPTPNVTTAYGATFKLGQINSSASVNPYANLIKVSLHGQKFYPAAAPYDTSQTDPARASTVSTGISSDSANSTMASSSLDGTSVNGRYISGQRWNKPNLLPPGTNFPLPDWIYVPRTFSPASPTTFNANQISAPNNMGTTTTIVGRYAYAIYDESGLLDINVAGVPSSIAASASVSATTSPAYSAYKDALAMADLTQIGLTQTQIDKIVGWRNNASAAQSPNTGTSTALSGNLSSGYTWSGSTGFTNSTNYWANVISAPNGFLRPLSAWPAAPSSLPQSDQFFTSRQQLIQFFSQTLGGGSTLMSSLQYLTHFSRGLQQPSFMPAYNRPAVIATLATGGNDKGGGTEDNIGATVATTGTFAKTTVNPSFLSARVKTQFVRNDGSIANVGDPLVKKRFALNRLAWLTYLGPIADDNGLLFTNSSSAVYVGATNLSNAQIVISQLETTYGFSPVFLAQGGPTNIQKYFGLVWVQDNSTTIGINDGTYKWKYEHGANITTNGVAGNTSTPGVICTLGYVAVAGRDPDFFELLKASVAVGSIAKAGSSTGSNLQIPAQYQYNKDLSVDAHIIQLGANIINQSNVANYPVRILFDDGTWTGHSSSSVTANSIQEYRGVADLPYLYRTRGTYIKLTDSSPAQTGSQNGSPGHSGTTTGFTSSTTGTGEFFEVPEIWAPHTWNPNAAVSSLRPTSFQLIPLSGAPVDINLGYKTSLGTTLVTANTNCYAPTANTTDAVSDPGEPAAFYINGEKITFTIPATTTGVSFFREPTLLNKPDPTGGAATDAGPPRGSQVAASGNATLSSGLSAQSNAQVTSWFQGACYTSTSTGVTTSIPGLTDNQKYLGFNFGVIPLWIPIPASSTISSTAPATPMSQISCAVFGGNNSNNCYTYQMQYLDPNANDPANTFITYDEKFLPLSHNGALNPPDNLFLTGTQNQTAWRSAYTAGGGASNDQYVFDLIDIDNYTMVTDPRTARFSASTFSALHSGGEFEIAPGNYVGGWGAWVDASQNALMSARPDFNVGWIINNPPAALGFVGAQSPNSVTGMAMGMFEQNLMTGTYSSNVGLFSGEGQSVMNGSTSPVYYEDADGVVRRASGGYSNAPASPQSTTIPPAAYNGLPMQTSTTYTSGTATPITYSSRPVMLNRPFRNVGELGYVFSGTPWKNIDFSTPESGFSALLDVFCINDTDDPGGLVAGKFNLNTRQAAVVNAVLTGAYKDEFNNAATGITASDAALLASSATYGLTSRTSSTTSPYGPLRNVSELVGKWVAASPTTVPYNGSLSYSGFAGDLNSITTTGTPSTALVQRFHETSIRALANTGQTRVWNLMIDVIAQTGRLPATASALNNFYVEGEQRYWVHLAIDRLTGQVLDQQIEVVKE